MLIFSGLYTLRNAYQRKIIVTINKVSTFRVEYVLYACLYVLEQGLIESDAYNEMHRFLSAFLLLCISLPVKLCVMNV